MDAESRKLPATGAAGIIELHDLRKAYGGVRALDGVSVTFHRGTVHAILGENGAGKSTLIKILAGVTSSTSGAMLFDGQPQSFKGPRDAVAKGVSCVFQELSLIPDLSVADNIFIGSVGGFGFYSRSKLLAKASVLLGSMGCGNIDPRVRVRSLSLPQRQLVEIAKALSQRPRVLILDESTSSLGEREVQILFSVVRKLREDGACVIYISHRMHEITQLADICSVFRNGRSIETFANGTRTDSEIIQMMIGRDIDQVYPPKRSVGLARHPMVTVRNLRWGRLLRNVDFSVGSGEIYGFGGLEGQGQKETLQALFGVLRGVKGEITIGSNYLPNSPAGALRARPGIALIPEDRKNEGLHLRLPIAENLCQAAPDRYARFGVVNNARWRSLVDELVTRLQIKAGSVADPVDTLSGGNQQKVVIGKYLATRPKVLLMSDPTRGIDVGTKTEVYRLIRELADTGATIILYSSDYDELIGLSDRIGIFREGRIVKELAGNEISEETILAYSFALKDQSEEARQT